MVISVRGTLGKVGHVPKKLEGANITANLMRLAPDRRNILPNYLFSFLKSSFFRNRLLNISTNTTIKTFTAPSLKKIDIPLPPLPLQQEFAERMKEIEEEKERQAEGKKKLNELFNSLMQRAFKGELVA